MNSTARQTRRSPVQGKRPSGKREKVNCGGPWIAVPFHLLRSRAFNSLSPQAVKLLMVLLAQLRPKAEGNGRLDLGQPRLQAAGWTSRATATAALKQLIDSDLVICTLQGRRGQLALYAVTFHPMSAKQEGLDNKAGTWTVKGWESHTAGASTPPTEQSPAVWKPCRRPEKQIGSPHGGNTSRPCKPAAELRTASKRTPKPQKDLGTTIPGADSNPSRVHPLRAAICEGSAVMVEGVDQGRCAAANEAPRAPQAMAEGQSNRVHGERPSAAGRDSHSVNELGLPSGSGESLLPLAARGNFDGSVRSVRQRPKQAAA